MHVCIHTSSSTGSRVRGHVRVYNISQSIHNTITKTFVLDEVTQYFKLESNLRKHFKYKQKQTLRATNWSDLTLLHRNKLRTPWFNFHRHCSKTKSEIKKKNNIFGCQINNDYSEYKSKTNSCDKKLKVPNNYWKVKIHPSTARTIVGKPHIGWLTTNLNPNHDILQPKLQRVSIKSKHKEY